MKTDNAHILCLEHISKHFGKITAVDDVSISVKQGEKIVIIGPSGSGKSTLLRAINILEEIDHGKIIFKDKPVGYIEKKGKQILDSPKNISVLRSEIGMVFQNFNLFPHMTVLKNVMEGPVTVLKKSQAEAENTAREMLAKVDLSDKWTSIRQPCQVGKSSELP